jgi:TP901 family phage tail tape measure protein
MKVIFELVVQDVNVTAELAKQKQLVKELTKELAGVDAGAEGFTKLAENLAAAKTQVADLTQQQKELNREFKQTQVPTDSLAGLRLEYSKLSEQISQLTKAERGTDFGKKLIQSAANVKAEINGIQESVGNFTGSVGNYRKALVSIFDLVSAGLVTGGIERTVAIIAGAIQSGVQEFAKYEKALDNLSALTGVTGKQLDLFAKKAEDLTIIQIGESEIVNSAAGVVEAFKLVGGAQPELLKSAESLADVTKQAIVLSAASGDELRPSVEALTTTLGQFQLGAGDASRIANELAAGAKAGASEIPDTTDAIKEFGTTAANTNVTTTESIALIQTLAEQQLKGSEAGTQLRNILAKLASADVLPRTAVQAFKEAGVNINILKDSALPLQTRLTELGKLSGDTSRLVKIFGLENLNAATILTNNVEGYKKFNAAISGTQEAYTQAEINANNLTTSYENLQKEGLNVLVEGFGALSPVLSLILTLFAKGVGLVGGFIGLLIKTPKFVSENKEAFLGLVTGLTILNGQLILASLNSIRLAAAERLRAAVTASVTAAQWLLNAAMTANPIGLVVTAVSALGIGLKLLYDRSETVRASISGLGNVASEIFKIVGESVTAFIAGFSKLKDGDISGALSSFGEAFTKANPIGIAFTQGERLSKAFNDGFNSKSQDDARAKAEDERDERQVQSVKLKAEQVKKINESVSREEAAAAKKRKAELDEQINRLKEVRKIIRELDAETIENEFDRKGIELQNQRLQALEKVEEARLSLEKKIKKQRGVPTENDKAELALISEQTASINAAYDNQQEIVSKNRENAAKKQLADLAKLSADVTSLAEQNAVALARAESEIVNTGFLQKQNELEAILNQRKIALSEQLEAGTISQKKFKDEFLKAQETFNLGTLDLERQRSNEIIGINASLEDARIEAARAALNVRLLAIKEETEAEIQAQQERARTQGGDATQSVDRLRAQEIEKRKAAEQEFADATRVAADERVKNEAAALDAINNADQKVHEDKLQRIQDEAEKRRELQQQLLDAAGTLAGAIFEIERNRIDKQEETAIANLDTEFQKRRDAAAGNAAELEKIELQYQARKEAIEKEAARKRKRTAIVEATIQGALAVVKSLPNLVLAALTAVATAAQIAVISSQTFEKGGIAQFRKSGTFGGKRHSQGGTKGVFDDGTQVEVEEDELFVVLNRRASSELRKLSNFNARHGGRRFADGGVLDFTPQFQGAIDGTSGGAVFVVAQFTDEQILTMADQIGNKTATETRKAVIAGLDDRNRTAEREAVLEENRQI